MSAVTTYLWKEWRDQRVTVFGILAVQFLASLFLALFVRDSDVGSTGMVSAITLGSLALTLVAFGPELIAGENRSGTLGLLSRMPSGLHLAFWAKVLFLFGALLGLFWSGYLISWLFHLMVRESWETLGPRLIDDWIAPGAVTLGLLLMAVSCWLPRSILTIPTAALLILALLLPCYFIWNRDLELASYLDVEGGIWLGPPLALVVLWLSFARGRRAGGGPGSSAWRGLLACVLASIPLWSWVGFWMHEWVTPRPHQDMRILQGFMGADGKLAFLNTHRRSGWPFVSLVVDLETGDWRRLGGPNEGVDPIGWREPFIHNQNGYGEHLLLGLLPAQAGFDRFSYLDTASGDVFHEVHTGAPYADILERARAARRNVSSIRLPDGRRVWVFRRRLEMDSEAGGFEELPWDSRDWASGVIGYGLRVYRPGNKFITYDLTRRRLFHNRTFYPDCCWVLESRWLVGDRGGRPPGSRGRGRYVRDWRLLDPDTGEEEPAAGMRDGDQVVAALDDGRVLVRRDDGEAIEILTVDITSGARRPLTMESRRPWDLVEPFGPTRAPGGRRLFWRFHRGERDYYLTSLAPGSDELTPPVPMLDVLGCPDDETALIISADRRRIERVNLLTRDREVVFPRPK